MVEALGRDDRRKLLERRHRLAGPVPWPKRPGWPGSRR
jgi:hypothetical protein